MRAACASEHAFFGYWEGEVPESDGWAWAARGDTKDFMEHVKVWDVLCECTTCPPP